MEFPLGVQEKNPTNVWLDFGEVQAVGIMKIWCTCYDILEFSIFMVLSKIISL